MLEPRHSTSALGIRKSQSTLKGISCCVSPLASSSRAGLGNCTHCRWPLCSTVQSRQRMLLYTLPSSRRSRRWLPSRCPPRSDCSQPRRSQKWQRRRGKGGAWAFPLLRRRRHSSTTASERQCRTMHSEPVSVRNMHATFGVPDALNETFWHSIPRHAGIDMQCSRK